MIPYSKCRVHKLVICLSDECVIERHSRRGTFNFPVLIKLLNLLIRDSPHRSNVMGSCHLLSLMLVGKLFCFVKMHSALSFSIRTLLYGISQPVSSFTSWQTNVSIYQSTVMNYQNLTTTFWKGCAFVTHVMSSWSPILTCKYIVC